MKDTRFCVGKVHEMVNKTLPTWTGPCFWSCFGTITRRWPTYQATWWEEPGAIFRNIGRVSGNGVMGRRRPRSDGSHAPAVGRLQFHGFRQGHLVLYALFFLLATGVARARGRDTWIRWDIFGRGRGEGEEVWAWVAGRQRGRRGRWVYRQGSWGAVVQRGLRKWAQVPGRCAGMRAQGFAAL